MAAIVPAAVTVHFKFGSEAEYKSVSVAPPATVQGVCVSILRARPDVQKMLADTYVGFELAISDPAGGSGRPLPLDHPPLANDARVEVALTKEYAVRAFDPVRKYVVGRFMGSKPPRFKAGKVAAVEWQMSRQKSEFGGAHPSLALVSGGKQRNVYTGTREGGQLGNYYLLMMQANTTDVCAIPMEQWYNFRPSAARQVFSLEEAEDRMERRSRSATTTSRWLERAKGDGGGDGGDDGLSDSEGSRDMKAEAASSDDEDDNDYKRKKNKKGKRQTGKRGGGGGKGDDDDDDAEENDAKTEAGDAAAENAPGARGMAKAEGDDWEHDEGASDDEGAGEADEMELDEPPPPPPPRAAHDSDDDADDSDLDEEGRKVRRLLGRQENGTLASGLGGSDQNLTGLGNVSDDSDDDDEFVDPDQEELHPFLLAQRNKIQAQKASAATEAAAAQKAAAEAAAAQKAAAERRAAAASGAGGVGGPAGVSVKPEPTAAVPAAPAHQGVKRSRSDDDVHQGPSSKAIKTEPGGGGGGGGGGSSVRPIESALREVLRKSGKPTTKDVTKQLRKRGLLSTDADKAELKETISRIARIRKEDGVSVVVLL